MIPIIYTIKTMRVVKVDEMQYEEVIEIIKDHGNRSLIGQSENVEDVRVQVTNTNEEGGGVIISGQVRDNFPIIIFLPYDDNPGPIRAGFIPKVDEWARWNIERDPVFSIPKQAELYNPQGMKTNFPELAYYVSRAIDMNMPNEKMLKSFLSIIEE
jgi:hypothetical protein